MLGCPSSLPPHLHTHICIQINTKAAYIRGLVPICIYGRFKIFLNICSFFGMFGPLKQYIMLMYPDTQFFPYIMSKVDSSETTNKEKYDHHSLGVRA